MHIKNNWICDEEGRSLMLRGCNLGGSTKVPAMEEKGKISFIGKPFPLEEAEERFAELKSWGLFFNRLVLPWETIEHEGPGIYDEAYLAYLRKLLLIAEKQGIYMWIDPHQDVWGRAAGGDGAPEWTLKALGIDTSVLEEAGAILPNSITETVPPNQRPLMTWPAGNNRYAAATMFTLFFAGNTFAPKVKPDPALGGISGAKRNSIEDWLQTHFIEAFAHARRRLKNCAAIAGWGTMNEPHPGFIGYTNLYNLENNMVAVGPMPGGFAAMAAASGYSMEIPVYSTGITGVKQKGQSILNPKKISIFKNGFTCPWKISGVWDDGENSPVLLKPEYFSAFGGRPVRFSEDFLGPFMDRFRLRLSEDDKKTLFFIEGVPSGIGTGDDAAKNIAGPNDVSSRSVHAFHWYDGPTMFLKQFRRWLNFNAKNGKAVLGKKAVASLYLEQIAGHILSDMPNLVGEFGLPFDLHKGRAFTKGDYSLHEEALSMYYEALDDLLLGACIWDYSADNTFLKGDLWNNEDFSIVTTRDGKSPLEPRALGGWLRPYPLATAGKPLLFKWDRKKKTLYFWYHSDPDLHAPTMLFIPGSVWGTFSSVTALPVQSKSQNPVIQTKYRSEEQLFLVYHHGYDGEIEIKLS